MKRALFAFASAATFAVGLAIAGMTDRLRVRAFLDVAGDWDPRLLWVMAAGILVFAPTYRLGSARAMGAGAAHVYALPTSPVADPRLLGGAVLFGVGWGIAGYCPGPALVALGASAMRFDPYPVVFVLAMVTGMVLHDGLARLRARRMERQDA